MFYNVVCTAFLFVCYCFVSTEDLIIGHANDNSIALGEIGAFKVDASTIRYEELNAFATCNETQACVNGASCLNRTCRCLPGTSGPYCEIVDDCQNHTLCEEDKHTSCDYSITEQKAYCNCLYMEYVFDEATRTCRDCLCSPDYLKLLGSFSNCEYKQGKQICTCTEGYAPVYDKIEGKIVCRYCDCNSNWTWCAFDEDGKQVCGCQDGYFFDGYFCTECLCGAHGTCDPNILFPSCACDEGYEEHRGLCVECSCGKYGRCLFDEHSKQLGCKCQPGYAEAFGKCEMCYCGDNGNCTFKGTGKVCECESGYEDVNGFCSDINECEKHNPCDESTACVNLIGSYECICKDGYELVILDTTKNDSVKICKDIDECENSSVCAQPNTFCENTKGRFNCLCMSGYVSRGMLGSSSLCEESTATKIYILISIFTFGILLVLGTVVYYLKKTFKESHSGYEAQME